MTNEEKAKDILNCKHCTLGEKICFAPNQTPCVYYRDIIKMAQWKDEQFAQEKKEIDEQWKRLMAESKSIGVDLLQHKEEQYKAEKQQWIEKACKWFKNHAEDFIDDEGGTIMPYIEDECFVRLKKAMEEQL